LCDCNIGNAVRCGAFAFFIAILKHESFPPFSSRESGPASGRFPVSAGAPAAGGLPVRSPVPRARLTGEAKAEHQNLRGAENGVDRWKGLNHIHRITESQNGRGWNVPLWVI